MSNSFYRIEAGESGAIENPNLEVNFKYYTNGIKIKQSWWHRIQLRWLRRKSRKAWAKYFKSTFEKEFDKSIKKIVLKYIENEK